MVKEVPISSKKYPDLFALVDDEDYEDVVRHKWHVLRSPRQNGPDVSYARNKRVSMHRYLLGRHQIIDHKDGNGLNNQRSNLRPSTQSQNMANRRFKSLGKSSLFMGVCWHKRAAKWQASLMVDGKNIYIGIFDREEDAARARDDAAREHFGEFAKLNFG